MPGEVSPKPDLETANSDEAVLLDRLRRGEPTASEDFVRGQTGMAMTTARRLLRNEADAQDAVQEAFLSFFRSLTTFKGESRLSTYLYRIVVNACLMKRRSKSRRPERSIEDLLPTYYADGHRIEPREGWSASAESIVQSEEARRRIRENIDELPEEYRNVILLRDIEQLDTAEAAAILGVSPGAIKTRLHRARQALRTLLERESIVWT